MVTISLDWIPNSSLCEFIKAHWYYLPESIGQGDFQEWMRTMQALLIEAAKEERGIKIELTSNY